jgi:hypothetical protein
VRAEWLKSGCDIKEMHSTAPLRGVRLEGSNCNIIHCVTSGVTHPGVCNTLHTCYTPTFRITLCILESALSGQVVCLFVFVCVCVCTLE